MIPELDEVLLRIRSDSNDCCLAFDKLRVILAQLRHVPAAVRSGKAPIENQVDVLGTCKIGEPDRLSLGIN
jgi:hypothetical protein